MTPEVKAIVDEWLVEVYGSQPNGITSPRLYDLATRIEAAVVAAQRKSINEVYRDAGVKAIPVLPTEEKKGIAVEGELKPCPFCGKTPHHDTEGQCVMCLTEDCAARKVWIHEKEWNHRAEKRECPSCRHNATVALSLKGLVKQQEEIIRDFYEKGETK